MAPIADFVHVVWLVLHCSIWRQIASFWRLPRWLAWGLPWL
jgi:hypothetical protein